MRGVARGVAAKAPGGPAARVFAGVAEAKGGRDGPRAELSVESSSDDFVRHRGVDDVAQGLDVDGGAVEKKGVRV